MNSQYKQVANKFNKIKSQIIANSAFTMGGEEIEEEQARCASLLESMANQNQYDHFQEVANYQDKYREIKGVVTNAKNYNWSEEQFQRQMRQVFGSSRLIEKQTPKPQEIQKPQDPPFRGNTLSNLSSISSIKTGDVAVPQASRTLDMFFKKKQSQISKKQTSFRRILESKDFQSAQESVKNMDASKHSRFSKSALKRQEQKQAKLKKIIDQHKKSLHKLQHKMKQEEQLNDFQKNLLREQKNRYLSKVQELQEQIQQLYRDNYRLKQQQKTAIKQPDSFNMSNPHERSSFSKVYEPYTIKTRHNDLNIINQKNMHKQMKTKGKVTEQQSPSFDPLGDKLEKQKPLTAQDFFNKKQPNMGLYGQKFPEEVQHSKNRQHQNELVLKALLGDSFQQNKSNSRNMNPNMNTSNHMNMNANQPNQSFQSFNSKNNSTINNGSRFDTFHMANTLSYINDDVLGQSRTMARISGEISTRNKVAFFKNSLVLIRNPQFQIAYKKSQLNESMDKIRLIFYINNKTNKAKRINIRYQYQHQYFNMKTTQKLNQVIPKGQGRQVLQISLISKTDLNGVTDMHVDIDDATYDLWLPICFIKFRENNDHRLSGDTLEMTVLPDRQFASFNSIKQILPVMFGGRDTEQTWAYLYGYSKFGNHAIKLTWHIHDLTIQTTQKWIDFIGFVFHFFK